MSYITRSDVLTLISDSELDQFVDDQTNSSDGDLQLTSICQMASDTADSYISAIYLTPFVSNIPAKLKSASLIFVCEALYARRQVPGEKNPFTSRANMWRDQLTDIGSGKLPLDVGVTRAFPSGVTVHFPSMLTMNTDKSSSYYGQPTSLM